MPYQTSIPANRARFTTNVTPRPRSLRTGTCHARQRPTTEQPHLPPHQSGTNVQAPDRAFSPSRPDNARAQAPWFAGLTKIYRVFAARICNASTLSPSSIRRLLTRKGGPVTFRVDHHAQSWCNTRTTRESSTNNRASHPRIHEALPTETKLIEKTGRKKPICARLLHSFPHRL